MHRLFANGLTIFTLALGCMATANAQYYPNRDGYPEDGRWRDGDRSYDRGYGDYRQAFYNRLQSDLERAAGNSYLRGGDLRRFEKARHEIDEFQRKWGRGRYDRHDLDDAIGATQRVANLPGLDYRDRAALDEDLSMMRSFRARMNSGYGYGYREDGRSGYYRPY